MTPSSPDGPSADDPRREHDAQDAGPERGTDAPAAPAPPQDDRPEAPGPEQPAAVAEPAVPGQEATGVPVLPQEAPAAVPAAAPLTAGTAEHADEGTDDGPHDEPEDGPYDEVDDGVDVDPYDEVDDEAPGDGQAAAAPAAAGRLRRVLPLVAAALAVVLLAALVVGLGLRLHEQRQLAQVQRPSGPALSAAREAGKVLFSYDYHHLDADFAAALALTTGSFTGEYRDFTEKVVKPVAVDNEVVVTASVSEAGATQRTTADQLVALVFVDQTTRSSLLADQAVDRSRVRMTLVKRGSAWKVSKVEAL